MRTIIVDDEPLARERLATLLTRWSDVVVVGECGDGKSAVNMIKDEVPDLVLLDIQLPELDGFEILDALPANQPPAIVFVTAYDRFAVKAFEVHAVDYLLKPVEADRLNDALNRVRKQHLEVSDSHTRMLEFMQAMIRTGYLFYIVKGTEVVAGALLLSGRFVPLALVVLSPVLVNILLFHAFLNAPQELIVPLVLLSLHLFLVWRYRAFYSGLFTASATVS